MPRECNSARQRARRWYNGWTYPMVRLLVARVSSPRAHSRQKFKAPIEIIATHLASLGTAGMETKIRCKPQILGTLPTFPAIVIGNAKSPNFSRFLTVPEFPDIHTCMYARFGNARTTARVNGIRRTLRNCR